LLFFTLFRVLPAFREDAGPTPGGDMTSIHIVLNSHITKTALTVTYIYIKNRSSDSSNPQSGTTLIANNLARIKHAGSDVRVNGTPPAEISPFLAWCENFALGVESTAGTSFEMGYPAAAHQASNTGEDRASRRKHTYFAGLYNQFIGTPRQVLSITTS
jgi:hypothetical protein